MSAKVQDVNAIEKDVFVGLKDEQTVLKATRSILTLFTHILVGIIVGVCFLFGLRNETQSVTDQHVLLCVFGYQLLMAEAILAMAPDSWLSTLNLKHKKLLHWIMQVLGSLLALIGSFIKILDKNQHWNTLHGQFALVAMVFTSVSLVNGLTSLYAFELRRFLPGLLSKLTHICFGVVGFLTASISLIYGFQKNSFRNWATSDLTDIIIILTAVFTAFVIINPFITFYGRFRGAINK
ncbi:hypothetical protein ACJJTC_009754 [Scirpophaga incertulas]